MLARAATATVAVVGMASVAAAAPDAVVGAAADGQATVDAAVMANAPAVVLTAWASTMAGVARAER